MLGQKTRISGTTTKHKHICLVPEQKPIQSNLDRVPVEHIGNGTVFFAAQGIFSRPLAMEDK